MERERERGKRGEEGRKKRRRKKGKTKYKTINLWGRVKKEIPNNQETFRMHSITLPAVPQSWLLNGTAQYLEVGTFYAHIKQKIQC